MLKQLVAGHADYLPALIEDFDSLAKVDQPVYSHQSDYYDDRNYIDRPKRPRRLIEKDAFGLVDLDARQFRRYARVAFRTG